MRRKQRRQRRLRKCERGIKTKSLHNGCNYKLTARGLLPFINSGGLKHE